MCRRWRRCAERADVVMRDRSLRGWELPAPLSSTARAAEEGWDRRVILVKHFGGAVDYSH